MIGIHASLLDGFDADLLERLRSSVSPVMVELPTGLGVEPADVRRGRLAQRLQQAIGYHVTFGEEES